MAVAGGPYLCLCGHRARDDGRLLQAVDIPWPEPTEPRLSRDAEEHGPPLGLEASLSGECVVSVFLYQLLY